MTGAGGFSRPEDVAAALRRASYVAGEDLATAVYLALALERPLMVEGRAGVGKTQLAYALAEVLGTEVVRLQCYEGIDSQQALYDWDYARQIAYLRAAPVQAEATDALFHERFLVPRPLLAAIRTDRRVVLLVDEVDRADEAFEAFLLEVLSTYTVTIPEIGTVRARARPVTVLTSNRTRELHDALKRRCFYHWIDYPDPDTEQEIVRACAPDVDAALVREVVSGVQALRGKALVKPPGVAETIDWARALGVLGARGPDDPAAAHALGVVAKEQEDLEVVRAQVRPDA